jgi:polysaccharide biosynthesis transport protein
VELRTYLEILRRRRAVIIAATLIVAIVAGVFSSLKTPVYTATAQVLLRPNDPSEQITQAAQQQNRNAADADRYVAAQLDIVEGEAVATAAIKALKGVSAKQVMAGVDATQDGATDIIKVSAVDPDPARASQMANAVANAYIENRKTAAVAGLEKASNELQVKLDELEQRISTRRSRRRRSRLPSRSR